MTVRDKQLLRQENLGSPIIVSINSVAAGLMSSWSHGEKTWPTYFHIRSGGGQGIEAVPHRPGSDEIASGIREMDGGVAVQRPEGDAEEDEQNVMPLGMYGQRRTTVPRARGRLYITFSLVEWVSDNETRGEDSSSHILPQPKDWPLHPEDALPSPSSVRAARELSWSPEQLRRSDGSQRVFRVLALDGGGVRGLLTASLIERLCRKFPNMLEEVDVIVGTSIGGLLSLLLAAGYSPEQVARLLPCL